MINSLKKQDVDRWSFVLTKKEYSSFLNQKADGLELLSSVNSLHFHFEIVLTLTPCMAESSIYGIKLLLLV